MHNIWYLIGKKIQQINCNQYITYIKEDNLINIHFNV